MLTKDDVKKLATLARIKLTDEEVEKFQKDLSAIFDYIDALMQVDIDGVEEVSQVTGLVNVQRRDEAVLTSSREEILAQAPAVKDGYLKVKAIL
jgi:aspartyl-tRNA(Asn)/glutamyl-tRNA(Gln) amidotransferase subunit C